MKLKKGDQVKILLGKDAGQVGKIEKINTKTRQAVVTGRNLYKRHMKPRNEGDRKTGGIVDLPRPILIDKLMVICPKCQKAVRVAYRLIKGEKTRICRLCKADL